MIGSRSSRSTVLVAATVVATLFCAAGPATATPSLTAKQFRKAANATCRAALKAVDWSFGKHFEGLREGETPSPASIREAVAEMVEILRDATDDIKVLDGPKGYERKVAGFLAEFERVIAEFEADPKAMFAAELRSYPFEDPDAIARRIGLSRCAQRG